MSACDNRMFLLVWSELFGFAFISMTLKEGFIPDSLEYIVSNCLIISSGAFSQPLFVFSEPADVGTFAIVVVIGMVVIALVWLVILIKF